MAVAVAVLWRQGRRERAGVGRHPREIKEKRKKKKKNIVAMWNFVGMRRVSFSTDSISSSSHPVTKTTICASRSYQQLYVYVHSVSPPQTLNLCIGACGIFDTNQTQAIPSQECLPSSGTMNKPLPPQSSNKMSTTPAYQRWHVVPDRAVGMRHHIITP